jgi:cytochrome b561
MGSTSLSPAPSAIRHPERYGFWAIVMHWTLFALLVGVGTLGLLHDSWPKHSQAFWINIHAVSGLTLWVLLVLRFCARLIRPPPPPPADFGRTLRRVAHAVHLAMYGLLFVIPIVGAITFIWHGRALDLGLLQVNFGVAKDRAIFEPTEDIHGYLAYAVFALAIAHALAALWHHFVKHDGVLRRMWPPLAGK